MINIIVETTNIKYSHHVLSYLILLFNPNIYLVMSDFAKQTKLLYPNK